MEDYETYLHLTVPMVISDLDKIEPSVYDLVQPKRLQAHSINVFSQTNSNTDSAIKDKKDKKHNNFAELKENRKSKLVPKRRSVSKIYLRDEEESFNPIDTKPIKQEKINKLLSVERPKRKIPNLTNKRNVVSQQTHAKARKSSMTEASTKVELGTDLENEVILSSACTLGQLSTRIKIAEQEIIKFLFLQGKLFTINDIIDLETAISVCNNFNIAATLKKDNNVNLSPNNIFNSTSSLNVGSSFVRRPPIVTIMGHVDHGKTTLLNTIRKDNNSDEYISKEKGGITQLIGAYQICKNYKEESRKITFLDTPGHEAFIGMRIRGIQITDIAVLVVAADDGIKPQTLEALDYIQTAQIPFIVAITKIDKEDSNIEKIKFSLSKKDVIPKDWGGNISFIPINALLGFNINMLLDDLLLIADMNDLCADPNQSATGTILESYLDKSRGPISSVLVQNGTLRRGDIVAAGDSFGKVRTITDKTNNKLEEAYPSSPVTICGLSKTSPVGSVFHVYKDEKKAKEHASQFHDSKNTLNLFTQYKKQDKSQSLRLILKVNTQGSLDAIISALSSISQQLINIDIVNIDVGDITVNDVELASSTNAVLMGFNTSLACGSKQAIERACIQVQTYNVIYDLIDDIVTRMKALLSPKYEKFLVGKAVVRTVFNLSKGTTAGCFVESGEIKVDAWFEIIRSNSIVYEGKLTSLKKVKDDVQTVEALSECGVYISDFQKWQPNDYLHCFDLLEMKKVL